MVMCSVLHRCSVLPQSRLQPGSAACRGRRTCSHCGVVVMVMCSVFHRFSVLPRSRRSKVVAGRRSHPAVSLVFWYLSVRSRCLVLHRHKTSYRPGGGETICPTADGTSTRGGSTSVRRRIRSPHISDGRPAAGSQRAYCLGWDRRTDRGIA